MNKVEFLWQAGTDLRVTFVYHIFRAGHSGIDTLDDLPEEIQVAFFRGDHPLPVPLVYIQGMQIAQGLVDRMAFISV